MMSDIPEKYSQNDWEHLRKRFSSSILKTTEIAELGRNVGISWPFKGSGETPEKYIKFSFEELQNVPGLIGKKKRVNDLMDILREILAFDDPFADMMDEAHSRGKEDRTFKRVLKKLQIPKDYPVDLMYFSPETREMLSKNSAKTLIDAIRLEKTAVNAVQSEDDFQAFLNGLALVDEATIKKHLPYRLGSNGLHLPEAIGLLVCDLSKPVQVELLAQSGSSLSDEEQSLRERASKGPLEESVKTALSRFDSLCSWFSEETADLKQLCKSDDAIKRYFLPINNAECERVAVAIVNLKFGATKSGQSKVMGKFSRLFKR